MGVWRGVARVPSSLCSSHAQNYQPAHALRVRRMLCWFDPHTHIPRGGMYVVVGRAQAPPPPTHTPSPAVPPIPPNTVISIVISLGKQGTVSPLRSKPLRKKVTIGQNERNVCVTQNLYACEKPYNIGCDRKKSRTFQPVVFSPYIILQMR